jgi:hypothetical protein
MRQLFAVRVRQQVSVDWTNWEVFGFCGMVMDLTFVNLSGILRYDSHIMTSNQYPDERQFP